ncbi:hypothetical protein M885DRAFT_509492 [Pelagophyceae sp. CCMP2097]|nr:hypothetical protein M885DRAFT_509492 [Pelagophyceae sp. CCMP2097]
MAWPVWRAVACLLLSGVFCDDSCPASDGCAGGLRSSIMIQASESLGLRACDGAERFLQSDPMTGAVIEICGRSNSSARALPVARCGEARIGGVSVDAEKREVYYASGNALSKRPLAGGADGVDLAGAYGVVVVKGDSFGDAIKLTIRGVDCASAALTRVSRFELQCVVADAAVVGPRAPPLGANCVTVTTAKGGAGSATSKAHAMLARAEYGDAARPAVFSVSVQDAFALRTRAIALDATSGDRSVFFSSLGSDDGHVFSGVLRWQAGALLVVLRGAPRITGLAYDATPHSACAALPLSSKGWLYYADAALSKVSRRPACVLGGAPGDSHDEALSAGLAEPRGLSLDPFYVGEGRRVVYVAAAGGIVRLDTESAARAIVVPASGHSAPDGVLVLPGNSSARGDRSLRLLWVDANRAGVRAATLQGTRTESLGSTVALRFPRCLARDAETRELVVGEWLGRIWRLPPPAMPHLAAELLRDDDSTQAAVTIRQTVDAEDRARGRLMPAILTIHTH